MSRARQSRDDYTQCWAQVMLTFGNVSPSTLSPPDIFRYVNRERQSARRRSNHELSLIKNMLFFAVARGDVPLNVAKDVKGRKVRPRTHNVAPATLKRFVDWARKEKGQTQIIIAMAEFIALTGSRRIEFRELHWPQVADVVRMVRAKQRGNVKTIDVISISAPLGELLKRLRTMSKSPTMGAVFPTKHGSPYTDSGFKCMWQKLMLKAIAANAVDPEVGVSAEERFAFHDLRAYYVTQHKAVRESLPDLHADAATTARIYDRTREKKRDSM